nr:Protein FAM133B like [Ipomoea batatas]
MKIGASMQLNWEKRRKKLMLQETCYFEWQNLLAEASRNGLFGEEELQWDSYKILNEQLEQEWLQSIQQRKEKPKGSKNQPKSAEQRRKISEAIAAKWADPEYRNRVCSGMAKQRGIPDGVERKERKRPSSNGQTRKRSPSTKKDDINGLALNKPKSQTQQVRLDKSSIPKYMDPFASSKLEMLKNIRTQRAAIDNKKDEALARAKLLIAEAEKAAKALEIAATKSPVAKASLIESRELIAEAIRYIESIDIGDVYSVENGTEHSLTPTEPATVDDMTRTKLETLEEVDQRKSNRAHALLPNGDGIHNFKSTGKHLHPLLNGKGAAFLSSLSDYDSVGREEKLGLTFSSNMAPLAADTRLKKLDTAEVDSDCKRSDAEEDEQKPWPNGFTSQPTGNQPLAKPTSVSKKWVRGRFVEAGEEG